uniref:Uncharacterized protein n=1 Tax=Rhizophora mucronata TaxID=61149 RepID=A0A2P2NSS4_RHIMU
MLICAHMNCFCLYLLLSFPESCAWHMLMGVHTYSLLTCSCMSVLYRCLNSDSVTTVTPL